MSTETRVPCHLPDQAVKVNCLSMGWWCEVPMGFQSIIREADRVLASVEDKMRAALKPAPPLPNSNTLTQGNTSSSAR